MGVNTINSPLRSTHLHSALTCWLHSPMQGAEAARLRQWCGHWRSGAVGLCTAVGRDRDTQEAWTVQSMVGTGQTRPGQPVERALKLASPNRPSRSQDGGRARMRRQSLAKCNCKPRHAFLDPPLSCIQSERHPHLTWPDTGWRGFKE